MDKKKIAIIYQGARFYGGIERYLEQLFWEVDKKNFELTLVSLGSWELTERLKKGKQSVVELPFKWYYFHYLYNLYQLIRNENYDLVVSQGMVANFYGRISAYFAKKPNLVTVHSNYDFDFHGVKRVIYWTTFKLFDFMTKKYIVVSKYLRDQLVDLNVSPSKIKIVYNGVSDLEVKPKKAGKELVIGTIGRLHFTKGYHNLIHAINLIQDEKFKVYIWGEGDEKNQLDAMIKQHRLAEKIELKGFITEISQALEQIDVYIQPSLAEGFGLTVVEAMLAEKPVIVTPAGSLPELVTDGKTGLVTKGYSPEAIAATMKAVINDHKLTLNLGKTARTEALERFNAKRWAAETGKIYLEAME